MSIEIMLRQVLMDYDLLRSTGRVNIYIVDSHAPNHPQEDHSQFPLIEQRTIDYDPVRERRHRSMEWMKLRIGDRNEKEGNMNRIIRVFCVLALAVVFLGGCGDKEKDLAMYKWTSFEKAEIEKIQAANPDKDLKPFDFSSRVVEVVGAPYRFKGFIGFKAGNIFREASYAFKDGKWQPTAYDDLEEDKEARKKREEIGKKIKQLKEDIADKEKELEKYNSVFEGLEAMKLQMHALETRLKDLEEKK